MSTPVTQPGILSQDHALSENEETPGSGIEDMQSEEDESEEDCEEEPPYSAEELGEMFTDFYRFLATLHYDPQDLKIPPPEGWNITDLPPSIVEKKSEFMVKVMRHLPYFSKARKSTQVDLQCTLIDYVAPEQPERSAYHQETAFAGLEFDGFSVQDEAHLLLIAWGYESCGCNLILDISEGVMIEDIISVAMYPSIDVREYFERQKEKYQSLEILVCPGREVWLATTSKAHEMSAREERGGPITEKEVCAQEERLGHGTG